MNSNKVLSIGVRRWLMLFFNRIMTPNTSPRRPPSGLKTMNTLSCFGQPNLQTSDLNPTEHLWTHLKKKLAEYENPPSGILELWERAEMEWNEMGKEVCQNLIESMPRRVEAVIKANGGYTKY